MPTREIDGHDVGAIRRALAPDEPRLEVVVAQTRKGSGISFMEDRMEWHYLPLTEPLYHQAVRETERAMRNVFCQSLVEASHRPEFVFLTGDLGYKALEPLRDAMGERFINAGVAEQNMVSVRRRPGARRPAALGLQHRAVRLCPAVRADPQRCLPAPAPGRDGRQRRRLRLRGDGGRPTTPWKTTAPCSACRTCTPTCRPSTATSARRSSGSSRPRTRPISGWASPRSPRMSWSPPTRPGGG